MDDQDLTIWCGNLDERVTEALLYELFLQAGPVKKVHIQLDEEKRKKSYAFICFRHQSSVPYALHLFEGTELFNRKLLLKSRSGAAVNSIFWAGPFQSVHPPVQVTLPQMNFTSTLPVFNPFLFRQPSVQTVPSMMLVGNSHLMSHPAHFQTPAVPTTSIHAQWHAPINHMQGFMPMYPNQACTPRWP